jgi:hypothetical protein
MSSTLPNRVENRELLGVRRPHGMPSGLGQCGARSRQVSLCPAAQRLAAAARAASLYLHEMSQSTVAHGADCGLGSVTDYSQSCSHRLPPKVRCDQARGSVARHTAAHPARHRCTAYHLAGIPRAQPLPGSDVFVSGSGLAEGRALEHRALEHRALEHRAPKAPLTPVQRHVGDETCCPLRSALSRARARRLRGHA